MFYCFNIIILYIIIINFITVFVSLLYIYYYAIIITIMYTKLISMEKP